MNYKQVLLMLGLAIASLVNVSNLHASAPVATDSAAKSDAEPAATAAIPAPHPAATNVASDATATAASAHAPTGASSAKPDEKERNEHHDASFSTFRATRSSAQNATTPQIRFMPRLRASAATVEPDEEFDSADYRQRNGAPDNSRMPIIVLGNSSQTRAATSAEIREQTVAQAVSGVQAKHQASDEERRVFSEQTPEQRAAKSKVDEEMFKEELEKQTKLAEIARRRQLELEEKWEAEDEAREALNRDKNRSKAEKAFEERAALQKKQYDARKKALQDPFLTRVADNISEGVDKGIVTGVENVVAAAIVKPFAMLGQKALDDLDQWYYKSYYERQAAAQHREETLVMQRNNVWKDSATIEHYAKATALTTKGPIQDQLLALKNDEALANELLRCMKQISTILDAKDDKKQTETLESLLENFDELREKFAATAMPSFFKGVKNMQELQRQTDAQGKAALREKVNELKNGLMLFSQLEGSATVKGVLKDAASRQLLVNFVKANRGFKVSEQAQMNQQAATLTQELMDMMSTGNAKLAALNQVDMARLNAIMGDDADEDQEVDKKSAPAEEKQKKEPIAQPKVAEVLAAHNTPQNTNALKAAAA